MDMVNKQAAPPLRSLNSIALAADGTVIWYDHHEDGYETVSIDTHSSFKLENEKIGVIFVTTANHHSHSCMYITCTIVSHD